MKNLWQSTGGKLLIAAGCLTLIGLGLCVVVLFGALLSSDTDTTDQAASTRQLAALPTATPTPPPPTNTPTVAPSPAPTATATPATPSEQLQYLLIEVLWSSNRDLDRLSLAEVDGDIINIHFTINDNLTEQMIKGGARQEVKEMLKAINAAGLEYYLINIEGSFSLVDQFGNSSEQTVIWATYPKETVDQINWANFRSDNIYAIASTAKQHPAFQEAE